MPVLSPIQQWVIALTRHVSGNLSVVASSIIVYHVVLRIQKGRATGRSRDLVTPYHRLMLGFSIADIIYSFWVGLSTLVVPASSGVIYGFGNTATCSAQGFFVQFSSATHLYMAMLSMYFLLKIRYNVSDDVLFRRYEIWFHLIPWIASIGSGTFGVVMELYNAMTIPEIGCWLGPHPPNCFVPGGPPCTRGYKINDYGNLYAFFMTYIWLFLSFLAILWCNSLIYYTIRCQERRNAQYLASRLQQQWSLSFAPNSAETRRDSALANDQIRVTGNDDAVDGINPTVPNESNPPDTSSTSDDPTPCEMESTETEGQDETCDETAYPSSSPLDRSRSSVGGFRSSGPQTRTSRTQKHVARASRTAYVQSILYVSSAGFTVVWIVLPYVVYKIGLSSNWRFFAVFMMSAFAPLQGLFNLLIFVRLEYLRLRSTKEWSRLHCMKQCLFSPDITDPGVFKSRRSVVYTR